MYLCRQNQVSCLSLHLNRDLRYLHWHDVAFDAHRYCIDHTASYDSPKRVHGILNDPTSS